MVKVVPKLHQQLFGFPVLSIHTEHQLHVQLHHINYNYSITYV